MFHQGEYAVPDVVGRIPMESVMNTPQQPLLKAALLSPLKTVKLVKKPRRKSFSYTCPITDCGEKFSNSIGLDTHLQLHLRVKPFTCNLCGKVCQTENKLKSHQASHANDGVKPVCDICERTFSNRSSLNKHKKMLHKPKPHVCPECHSGFEEHRYLAIHAKQTHNLDISLEDSYVTFSENSSANSKGSSPSDENSKCYLMESVNLLDNGERKTSSQDNALPSNSNDLQKSLDPVCESSNTNRDAPINCEFCTSTFPSVAYLEQHMAVHMIEKTNTCHLSPVNFACHDDLANRMKKHETENEGQVKSFMPNELKCPQTSNKYVCPMCKEHFVNLGSLKRHQAKGQCAATKTIPTYLVECNE